MNLVVCEMCYVKMRPTPKVLQKFTKVNPDLSCNECGVEPGTLYVEVKK